MDQRFETFTVLINKISRSIKKIKNQEMAEYDLRSVHVSCLYYLYSLGSMTATDLCEKCEEDKATISRAIDHLERNGFVCRRSGEQRRYKSPLSLTEKGRVVGRQIEGKVDAVLQKLSVSLSEHERIGLYRSLSIISESLEQCANDSL
ncbi:MAG: MarR family transcriptional regulator [Ruminococcaceae bacterium]|nr:MarR family transcriptional regulator [Oscillospiraceae bacterium]